MAPVLPGAAPAVLMVAAIAAALAGFAWRVGLWRRGRPRRTAPLAGLLALPRRYLVDVHEVVAREPRSARMHMLAAGGFLACMAFALLLHLGRLSHPALAWAVIAAAAATLAGAGLDQARRAGSDGVRRLSHGAYRLLPAALAAVAVFQAFAAAPATGLTPTIDWAGPAALGLLALGGFGLLVLVPGMALGPMRHAFAGAAHLAFHPRPERFAGEPAAGLRPLDLEAKRLGVETPREFFWNQLLGFDACVQCGRCEVVCPAFAAGAPLNPKKLIFDLYAAGVGPGTDAAYGGHPYPGLEGRAACGGPDQPLVGETAMIHPDTLWACTTCRACVEECPMLIEHVDAVVDLRRNLTLERGELPGKAPQALENLALTDNAGGQDPVRRLDWAADLALPLAGALDRPVDVLLWLGEGAFDVRGQRTLRALVKILRHAGVDFAVLGEDEADTGDLARRLGDEAGFQRLARHNVGLLARHRFSRILTADPHVLHALAQEYAAFGGLYDVVHHTSFIAELMADGRLPMTATAADLQVTYHDPCYLGRYNGVFDSPREVLRGLGAEIHEMERSGPRSFCCGGGGGAPVTDVPGKRRIPDLRMDQARETGAPTVVVACPNCAVMLEGASGPRPTVADVAELVAEALDAGGGSRSQ